MICPLIVYGQYEFRPIIDSTVVCSYNKGLVLERYFDPDAPEKYVEKVHMEFFYIVEQMPIPEIELTGLEKALEKEVRHNEQEKTLDGKLHFQCIVNCKGKAGDFQIIHCPDKLSNICCQVFYVIREKLVNWQPGKQRDQNVDILIKIQVTVENGKFKVLAPVS